MADVFGDLSLFSEFDKDREAEGSFIRYDEDSARSRIIFEGFASDEDEESADEKDEQEDEDSKKRTGDNESETDNANDSPVNGKSSSSKSKHDSAVADSDEGTAWLNEQLFADAEEEARGSNVSINQLMFDKNKYERFCKILDSSRFVPDEDSPPVQIMFHNSAFARKYRQQIEQFIKSLLWDFQNNDRSQDSIQEVTVKPGTPSSVDINSKLKAEQRYERMRQKHALIGSCQFHNRFLVDFLGWPFSIGEPTRCNENWEVPLYSQVFNEVYADPANAGKSEQKKKGAKRYHLDPELASKLAKFQAGHMSNNLREAMGLREDQLPQHIYKMRLFGYPPGWLAEAKLSQSSVTIFDKNGRVTLITGECLEDGELDDENKEASDIDVKKILEYPGFTVPVPLGFVDEHATFQMPPIQQHQLKKTLMKQSSAKKASRKRKKVAEQDEKAKEGAKKAKISKEDGEEGEIGDNDAADENEDNDADTQPTNDGPTNESLDDSEQTTSDVPTMNRSSSTISLSRDYGTPILVREKSDLPDASKFGVGIEDHIPFENLPDSTGMFIKMKDLIDAIRKKKAESS